MGRRKQRKRPIHTFHSLKAIPHLSLWLQIQFSADSDSVSNDDVYDSSHADWNAKGLLCDGKAACFFSQRYLFSFDTPFFGASPGAFSVIICIFVH